MTDLIEGFVLFITVIFMFVAVFCICLAFSSNFKQESETSEKKEEIEFFKKGNAQSCTTKDASLLVYETSTYKSVQILYQNEVYGMCKVFFDKNKEREIRIKEDIGEKTKRVLHTFFSREFAEKNDVEEKINHLYEMIGKVNVNDFSLEEQHELNRLKKRELRLLDCHYSFLSDEEKEKEKERFLHLLIKIEEKLHKTIASKDAIEYEKTMKIAEKRYIK